jgi:hypothetical protein
VTEPTASANPPALPEIERWFQGVITHPAGVAAGVASEGGTAEDVITRSQRLTALERIEIYAQAYSARLVEVLRGEFPALAATLGPELFTQFALGYLSRHPSTSHTLGVLGQGFPEDLATTRPPRTSDDPDWADFLIDLARVERTYAEVFDGPGSEQVPPPGPEVFAGLDPATWPETRWELCPSLRLLELRFPVHQHITAIRRGDSPTPPAPSPTWLMITRRDFVVRRTTITPAAWTLLDQLQRGQSIAEGLQRARPRFPEDDTAFSRDIERLFRSWSASGLFRNRLR